MKHNAVSKLLRSVPIFVYLGFILFFVFFPFYWMFATSIKTPVEAFMNPPTFFPRSLYLQNYYELFFNSKFIRYIGNSILVAGSTTLIAILVASLAAYAFSKFRFRGNTFLSLSLFLTQLFPAAVILIPLFVIFRHIKIYNTYGALILSYLAFSLPVSVWLLIGFFNSIPSELIDAALIDGCTRLGVFFRVILPLGRIGIVATGMYVFLTAWSELLFALTFTTSKEIWTVPVGLAAFIGQYTTDWGVLMAAASLASLPVLVIFFALQRYFVRGMMLGAVRG